MASLPWTMQPILLLTRLLFLMALMSLSRLWTLSHKCSSRRQVLCTSCAFPAAPYMCGSEVHVLGGLTLCCTHLGMCLMPPL